MHLKSITLRGFKSFADKTNFLFEPSPSITAIVGPNGCGKSNVIDALRFVIGEQSIKELRGTSLEQVIFAGTSEKRPVSLAEVAISIDNSDGRLKADYSEVMIKRRVFRSGESEFYINKNLCRLKDIKDLFLDTGIGDGAYSIVNQGQIDAILSSKPEDRRAVFEEAAAIGKYRVRKRAAERRLIGTEQNLLRVNDLKGEIRENISLLEEQAAKATKYTEAKAGLRTLEVGLAKKSFKALREKKAALDAKIEELRGKTTGAETGVLKEEEEKDQLKASVRTIEENIEQARSRIERARKALEEAKSGISVGRERLSQLEERAARLKEEKEKAEALLKTKFARREEAFKDVSDQEAKGDRSREALEEAKKALDEINRKVEESVRGWNTLKNPIFEREIEITSRKHGLAETDLSIKYSNEALSKDKLFLENLKGLKEDISLLEEEASALEGVSQELKERLASRKSAIFQKIDIEIEVIEKSILARQAELEGIFQKRDGEATALEELEKSVVSMNQQSAELEQKMNALTAEKEKAIERLGEARAACQSLEETFGSKRKQISGIEEETSQIENDLKEKTQELSSLLARIESTHNEIGSLEKSVPELETTERLSADELSKLIEKRAGQLNKIEALEEKIKAISNDDRYFRDALAREEIGMAKLEGELSSLETLMKEEYSLTPDEVLSSEAPEVTNAGKAREEIDSLKSQIRDMGLVNLLAVEEFAAAKERISFIESQYADLVSARDNLSSLIRQLDNEARTKFTDTIDMVNRHFTELFSTLFEGGEAKITLSEGDVLEAGIEIMARPSGKKWLSLGLMSGGEKALTAISILFALIRTNPSPFCFLDEVDAALDEINTIRFTRLLKDFSRDTQIVVITHSKRTMSAASTMYGVTMEEPGVSKLVSMKLVKVAD